jgi:hypothetical protein
MSQTPVLNGKLNIDASLKDIWDKGHADSINQRARNIDIDGVLLIVQVHHASEMMVDDYREVNDIVESSQAHFTMLGSLGMNIVTHTIEAAKPPRLNRVSLRPSKDPVVAYSALMSPDMIIQADTHHKVSIKDLDRYIATPALNYLDWLVNRLHESYILDRLDDTDSYGILEDNNQPFLFDIGPIMRNMQTPDMTDTAAYASLIKQYRENIVQLPARLIAAPKAA